MPESTPNLSAAKVLCHTQEILERELSLHAEGYKCHTADLFKVLLGVAATRGTLEAVCADLVGTPDPQTVREYFNEQFCVEELPALERQLNAALVAAIPRQVRRQAHEVAMDFHDRPYYGAGPQEQELWVRGRAKDGTTRFYRVATAYVVCQGLRVTLAVHFVLPEDDTGGVVALLLQRVRAYGLRVTCLLLDKGFASVAVFAFFERQGQAALIACPIRGSRGGTRALCHGRKSYCTTHPFVGNQGGEFSAAVLVCRVMTTARRTGRHARHAEWLVFVQIHLALSPRYARHLYHERFGIETSYRCEGRVRGWTTAKNPAYRFVLIALAFVLLNVWLQLRWLFTQIPRRGHRGLDTPRFQLTRFAQFLQRALEAHYGCVQTITAAALPRGR